MMGHFNANYPDADQFDLQNRGILLMRDCKPFGSLLWAVLLVVAATFGLNGCGNVNDVAHPNNAPVANAGPDLGSVASGTRVTLNGSGSTDPNGNPLTYSWTFLSKPAGSAAVLANPTSVTPSFTVDRSGDYVVQLIVNDGGMNSAPDSAIISTNNVAPVANAGPDQGGKAPGSLVTLDGSASTDGDGDPLTYSWTLLTKPAGSAAVLSGANTVNPTFTVDRAGDYTAQLIVNDGTVDSAPNNVIISTVNVAPVANAGPDQGGKALGSTVTLNGSASSDANGDPLTYLWSLTAKPAGSAAVLSSLTSVSPTFTVDFPGTYVAQLIVNDGTVNSAPNTVSISTVNVAPVANAGPDQGGKALGSTVTLNGSASSDANGDPLAFSWSLTSRPAGSTAVLSSLTIVNPTFTVDRAGTYTAQLIVNDGTLNSAPNTVNISTVNVAPVANAGPDQGGKALGSTVTLNGSASSDANGDPLTFSWSLTSRPAGSTAALSSLTIVNPTFTIDRAGDYTAQLIVNDGTLSSAPNTVNISTVNVAPVANAGPDQGGKAPGSTITLDGSDSSDANGDPLTYLWSLTAKPAGSTAALSGANTVNPTFTVDRAGTYTAQLIVNDGTLSSAPNTVNISTNNVAPVADAGPNQGGKLPGALVTLDGSGSSDANGDPLTYLWSLTAKPAGSTAALSGANTVNPTFTVDRAGTYTAQLIVNDGTLSSAPITVNISTNNVAPVANAGPDQGGKAPGSLITLNGSASSDANGDPLTYLWSLSKPAGSAAALSGANTVNPTFTVDRAGTYTAQLIVNDGTVDSAPNNVIISTVNVAPMANAGPDQGGKALGSTVTLNGSASSDANGDPLTYLWSLTAKPAGSAAVLSSLTSVSPTFTVDFPGTYVAQLIVNDGTVDSAPNTVFISTVNVAPVANAGPDQGGKAPGSTVTLNGSGSTDANGDPLTYSVVTQHADRQRRGPIESHQREPDLYRRPRRHLYGAAHRQRWHAGQRTHYREHLYRECRAGGQRRPGPDRGGQRVGHPGWQRQLRCQRGSAHV